MKYILIGLPGDTTESVEDIADQLADMLQSADISGAQVIYPLPGPVLLACENEISEPPPNPTTFALFTKRTDDPKLAYIERELDKRNISHRRNGASFHAPILEVDGSRLQEAWGILIEIHNVDGKEVWFDDIPDDHPMFEENTKSTPQSDSKMKATSTAATPQYAYESDLFTEQT